MTVQGKKFGHSEKNGGTLFRRIEVRLGGRQEQVRESSVIHKLWPLVAFNEEPIFFLFPVDKMNPIASW
jgi:hypothetical protein